ncbi:MAG: hypothetical protein ACK5MQ_18130 [Pikeienuella sp.]
MIAELREEPPPPPAGKRARPARPKVSIGHAGRLNMTGGGRWLIFALILIFIAAQLVDELVDWLAEPLRLVPAQAAVLEVALGLILFLLWSVCMLAWVRGARSRRDRD